MVEKLPDAMRDFHPTAPFRMSAPGFPYRSAFAVLSTNPITSATAR